MKAIISFVRNHLRVFISSIVISFCFVSLNAQLAGTYFIGPADSARSNFNTFAEVADTLNAAGISDSVIFNVLPNLYTDVNITINAIAGADVNNQVIFQSSTGDSNDVTLTFNYVGQATNWMIKLVGTQYVTFKHMSYTATAGNANYGMIFFLSGGASHLNFLNNVFYGKVGNWANYRNLIHGGNDKNEYVVIENNAFYDGEDAIHLDGTNETNLSSGNVIRYNQFYNQYDQAIALYNQFAPIISDNFFDINPDGKTGIYMEYADNAFRIVNNKIEIENPAAGISLFRCDGLANFEGRIANNFIDVWKVGNENTGIRLNDCDFLQIYHNSVRIYSGWNEASRCFYQEGGSASLDVRNNIFANRVGGYAFNTANTGSFSSTNNNDYYTNGNYVVRWGTSDKKDLAAFQTTRYPDDDESISVHPVFLSESPSDLHTTTFLLKDKGADLTADIPDDIDGDTRSITPCIGADEYTTATGAALTGTITIGADQNLTTISAAVDSMNKYGISGPVVFNIKDNGSPYDEMVYIMPISGASASNTVTFRRDPANTGDVIITHDGSSGGNQTIHLLNVSHVIFRDLTISAANSTNSTVIRLNGHCTHDSIIGCTLNSLGTSSNNAAVYSSDDVISDIHLKENVFTGGYRGFYINGLDDASLKPTNISVINNTFSGHYSEGVYLRDCNAPVLTDNEFTHGALSYNYWGIYLEYCNNNYQILRNKVLFSADDGGILVSNSSGSSSFVGKIINNYVQMDGTDPLNGIYTYNSSYIDVYFNTSLIKSNNSNTGSNAYANVGGSNIRVKNNNFTNFGSGMAYYNDNVSAIVESDYNNLFSGGLYIGRWGSSEIPRLAGFRSANSMDANSIKANPWFLADGEPGINSSFLDDKGVAITGITSDFYGDARNNPPDIGADEFTASIQPLAGGSYTIGLGSPDYETVLDAMTDLQLRGISGAVTFNILTGDYNERIPLIQYIAGTSATDTVVLKSESGNPEDVRIYYVTDNNSLNVVGLRGVDYFTIKDLTISAQGTTDGRPLGHWRTFRNFNVINNILTSANTTNSTLVISGIVENVQVKNNTVSKGNDGIYLSGTQTIYGINCEITGNTISGTDNRGIYMPYHFSPTIIGNTIENTLYTGFEGIYMSTCADEVLITGNTINNVNSDYGIRLNNCKATNPFFGLISNNMVRVGGTYTANGIYLNDCARMFVYHNTVNITSTHNNYGRGIYTRSNNSEIEIINNVIANTGNAYSLVIEDLSDVPVINFNNLYTKGSNFAWWNFTTYSNLAEWQAASSRDANSISVEPLFYSASDLHSGQLAFHQKATPLSEVTIDIDSVPRDPLKPDLGAAEFSCVTPTFNVYVTPTCQGDSTILIDSSINIAPGSSRGWDFTGDAVPDIYTENDFEAITWLFTDAGVNTVTYIVQQIAGCNDFVNIDVPITPPPALDITTKGAYCDTTDGWANVSVTNLPGPFRYFWSDGQKDSTATGLAIGTYTVAVTDETGCTTTEDVEIGEAIEVTVTQIKPSTCGIPDGSAVVSATGGFAPYTYVWSNGETTDTNKILSPGTHYVNVIDSKGCYAQGSINLASDGGPQVSLVDVTNNDCYGDRSGSIDISVSGGIAPYSILWSNGKTTQNIDSIAAGIYNVTVEDADGCLGAGSFQVLQPSQITISPVVTPATCDGSDGSAVAVVSGGTKPYVYQWSSGGVYRIEEGLAAGVYSVTVLDGKGCQMVEPVLVNNVGAPEVTITGVQGVGCTVTDNGSISISASPPNPFYTYSWSSGQTTPAISGLTAGTYEVTVTDESGCKGVNQAVVRQEPPGVNPICLVTVDTASGMNLVIWEKTVTDDVSHYNIYRESSVKSDYKLIASVDVDSLSLFIDSVANPSVRSWRYKLSVVDLCGNESKLSPHHKTIHLTMNVGLVSNTVNLIWDHYEGFDVPTYTVYRTVAADPVQSISDLPANLTSYTDDISSLDNNLFYYIEVLAPDDGCTATDFKAATLNATRSNRKTKLKSSTGLESIYEMYNLSVYPNPSKGIFNLDMDLPANENIRLKVFDVTGKLLLVREFLNQSYSLKTEIDLSLHPAGIYHIHIRTDNALIHRVLIKE